MTINAWFMFAGLFFLAMVLIDQWLKKAPLSSSIVYLLFGVLLGPSFLHLIQFDFLGHPNIMEIAAEIVVIVSLFSAGLKLQFPLKDSHWKVGATLASCTMIVTVALVAVVGHYLLNLPWGAAILLGGILAPTDPVLASEVQVEHTGDRDQIRRSLTGEAGFNDGTAFPAVMLGLVLMGHRWADSESPGLKWLMMDFLWAIPVGIMIGAVCGWICANFVRKVHGSKDEKIVIEDFIAIGLIGAAYGLAQLSSAYGFLAVFAAGVMFGYFERKRNKSANDKKDDLDFSSDLIRFSTQLERIGEVAIVIFIGYAAASLNYSMTAFASALLLIFIIRPIGVFLFLRKNTIRYGRSLIGWFGIRGIGSVYYLFYAMAHGLEGEYAEVIYNTVFVTIIVSIILHGASASPLMKLHNKRTS